MKVEGNESHRTSLRRMTVFVIVMLPLVIGLGVWQLHRAAYKQSLMDDYFDKLGGLPTPLSESGSGEAIPDAFTRIRARGSYTGINLLLDNQVNDSRQGYWVYTPFIASGSTWVVNRGWFAAPAGRDELPQIPPVPEGEIDVVAIVWPDTGMLPLFGEAVAEQMNDNTWRLQRLDFEAFTGELNTLELRNLKAVELRLEVLQPGVLLALPQTIGFGVERHQGYAFQWFGLAIALIIGYFFYRRSILVAHAQSNSG